MNKLLSKAIQDSQKIKKPSLNITEDEASDDSDDSLSDIDERRTGNKIQESELLESQSNLRLSDLFRTIKAR